MKTLTKQSAFVWMWLPVIWALLGAARFIIIAYKFNNITALLGVSNGVQAFVPIISPIQLRRARQIQTTIAIASKYTPWTSNCFPQAITARLMLGLYHIPYAAYFGLRKEDGETLMAHAWVVSGACYVSGGRAFHTHVTVGCFGRQSWNLSTPGV